MDQMVLGNAMNLGNNPSGLSGLMDHHLAQNSDQQTDINELLQQIINITDQTLDEAQQR